LNDNAASSLLISLDKRATGERKIESNRVSNPPSPVRLRRPPSPEGRGILNAALVLIFLTSTARAADADKAEASADEPTPKVAIAAEDLVLHEPPIADSDRQHWSFKPLVQPAVPKVADKKWCKNEVDRFILARLSQDKLAPQPTTDKRTLLRRVKFDLTGLPPTPDEIAAFEADKSSGAYARVVDRLLESQAYGERWGQHWLDLVRFAETDGFEHDKVRKEAWRYRDWVIEALNADMPLDQFIEWQIAGDELEPDEPLAAIATGFLLAGPDMPDLNLKDERRHMVLNEITSTVGAVFLGLQVGCAQCHDHKYDPISQADFYRLRAVFEPAELFGKESARRVVRESGTLLESHLMIRGDFRRPGPIIDAAFPRIANASNVTIAPSDSDKSSGRRSSLARWITSDTQPLTTRVLANWVWQQHFGQGLSRSPGDFGVMGEPPSHSQLLDWLAVQLKRDDWSLKKFHRRLVTSNTYQQSSRAIDRKRWNASIEADPENRLLARINRRRLEGEAIRDAMLSTADRLSENRGGPGIMAPLPEELVGTLLKGQWKVAEKKEDHRRRSVYLFVRRNLRYPLFEAFDRPDTNASCPRRNISTTAPQALVLLNSEFSLSAARDLAEYLSAHAGDDVSARIALLYERTLGRQPTAAELAAAQQFAGEDDRWVDLCLAMFNLNEFVYLD
jgi:hypothetical protein